MVKLKEKLQEDREREVPQDLKELLSTEEGMRKVILSLVEKIEELEK